MATTDRQRITLGTFDFIKGFAMVCIVLGHTINLYHTEQSVVLSVVPKVLRLFGPGLIPAFFIISGYGFKEKSPKTMLRTTFTSLIIPYLWVAAAFAVFCPVIHFMATRSLDASVRRGLGFAVSMLLGNTKDRTLFGLYLPWWMPTWYLLTSFVSINVLNFIVKIKKPVHQYFAVLASIVLGYGFFVLDLHLFCIAQGLMAVGFFYLGYTIKKQKYLARWIKNIPVYALLLVATILQVIWGQFDLCSGTFRNVVLDYIGSSCAGVLFMLVGIQLGRLEWWILQWVKQIGIYSYWIICIHSFEANALPWSQWAERMLNHQLLAFVIELALKTCFIAVICMVLKEISKYKYRRRMMRNGK